LEVKEVLNLELILLEEVLEVSVTEWHLPEVLFSDSPLKIHN
jgi:hypothetical protein